MKAVFRVVGEQPVDRMWSETDHVDHGKVVGAYGDFMKDLLEKLELVEQSK